MQDISSFKKGEKFENYVNTVLFPESDYVLVHRTNNYDQNKDRFAENTLMPDFKFRCKRTHSEFYVEAKYRSSFNQQEKLEVMNLAQKDRFLRIQETESIPVFIVVGYKGQPENPTNISFFPLNELLYLGLYPSFLRKFNLDKTPIHYKDLNLETLTNQNTATEINKNTEDNLRSKSGLKKMIIASSLVIFILLSWFVIDKLYFDYNDVIHQKTKEYYKLVELNDVEALGSYISPKVLKWYDESNLTNKEVKEKTYEYLEKFPKSDTDIRWDTFKVERINDDYLAKYKLIHTIKTRGKYYNKVYDLTIEALWSKDFKLKSIYEVK
jgi:hypothetical protein